MHTRKSHNSVLVLATLGMYLGLVLVGATPQVLAQAAMTRQFNVKDEVEVRDDLDKKPSGCDESPVGPEITDLETKYLWFNHRSISEYRSLLEQVLEAYPESVRDVDITWSSLGELRPSRRITASVNQPIDDKSARELGSEVVLVGNGLPGKSFSLSFFRNSLEDRFRFESQAIPFDGELVNGLYANALVFARCAYGLSDQEEQVLDNTKLSIEGSNLVITTRLARGSLDTLPAHNAK